MIRELEREPEAYGFFQAVRLLEIAAAARRDADPESVRHGAERARLGFDGPPDAESVFLAASPSLCFATSELCAFEARADAAPRLTVSFLGMVGAQGVLPQHYTELVLERSAEHDDSARDFLDLFHHRALSFFYRAWAKHAVPFACALGSADSGAERRHRDPFTFCLLALAGGSSDPAACAGVPPALLAFHVRAFARQSRPHAALEQLLCEHFELPIRVEPFVGRWLDVPVHEQTRVGAPQSYAGAPQSGGGAPQSNGAVPQHDPTALRSSTAASHSSAAPPGLGHGMCAGRRVWDVRSKVRLHAGPLRRAQFERIGPGTDGGRRLVAIARRFLGPWIDFDLRVELAPGEAPRAALASAAVADAADAADPSTSVASTAPIPESAHELDGTRRDARDVARAERRDDAFDRALGVSVDPARRDEPAARAPSSSAASGVGRLGQDTWLIGDAGGGTAVVALFSVD